MDRFRFCLNNTCIRHFWPLAKSRDVATALSDMTRATMIKMGRFQVKVFLFVSQSPMAASCQQSNSSCLMGWRLADEASECSCSFKLCFPFVLFIVVSYKSNKEISLKPSCRHPKYAVCSVQHLTIDNSPAGWGLSSHHSLETPANCNYTSTIS